MLQDGKSLKGVVRWMWLLWGKDSNRVVILKKKIFLTPGSTSDLAGFEPFLNIFFYEFCERKSLHLKLNFSEVDKMLNMFLQTFMIHNFFSLKTPPTPPLPPQSPPDVIHQPTLRLQRSFRSLLINSQQQTFSFLQRECVNGPWAQLKHKLSSISLSESITIIIN